MKMHAFILLLLFSSIASTLAGDPKIEKALRDLDNQWSKAAGSKDVDKTISFYSDDAVVMPSNDAAAKTKDAIWKIWGDLLAGPGAAISWKTTKIEVAKSGDIGYSSGTYELTMNDASGKPVQDRGKYLEVWKKQTDGKWKCVMDIWNSDLPASPPASAGSK